MNFLIENFGEKILGHFFIFVQLWNRQRIISSLDYIDWSPPEMLRFRRKRLYEILEILVACFMMLSYISYLGYFVDHLGAYD